MRTFAATLAAGILLLTMPAHAFLNHVANNTELSALKSKVYPIVMRDGFAAAGDAPPLMFIPSNSACTLNAGAGDGGSQVASADSKCWLAVFPAGGADLRQWGARAGQNVDIALKAAIAWACSSHTPILIPYVQPQFLLNSEIDIGNGSSSQFSTCNGVSLIGVQPFMEGIQVVNLFQLFKWNGTTGIIPFNVKGPISNISIAGIGIDCNSLCSTGFNFDNVDEGDFNWLAVWNQIGPAFIVTSEAGNSFGTGAEFSHYKNFVADLPALGGSGMVIGAASAANCATGVATIDNTFENILVNYDSSTAGTFGFKLQYATQIQMSRLVTTQAPAPGHSGILGNSLVIAPPSGTNCNQFPTDIHIDHPIFQGAAADTGGWAPSAGGIGLTGWSTVYQAFPISTNYNNFFGTDSKGNRYPGPVTNNSPSDTSGAGLTLTGYTTTYKTGNQCIFEFDLTYPATANGNAAAISLPTWCATFATASAVAGTVSDFQNVTTPLSVVCTAGGTTCNFYNPQTGAGYTNAGLSGKNLRGTASFIGISN